MMSKNWPKVALGEILTERNEIPDPVLLTSGGIPVISKIRFADGKIEFRNEVATKTKMILIYPGDLVVSGINAMKGAIAVYQSDRPVPSAATIHYAAYKVNSERADTHFLWRLLRSSFFQDVLTQQVPQGIKTELKSNRLLPIVIPFPPLDDQQRIVNKIAIFEDKILEIKRLQSLSIKETTSLFEEVLSKILSDEIYEIQVATLEQLLVDKPKNGKSIKSTGENFDVRCLTLSAMRSGFISLKDSKPISLSNEEAKDYAISKDAIYICRGNGSKNLVGQAAISLSDEPLVIFPDLMIRIKPNYDLIDQKYLLYYWQSSLMRKQIENKAKTTAGIWKINQQHLLSLEIYYPKDRAQQGQIVKLIESVKEKISSLVENQKYTNGVLDFLMASIIDKAFYGNL